MLYVLQCPFCSEVLTFQHATFRCHLFTIDDIFCPQGWIVGSADECYKAFVITETWHKCSGSTTLKQATLPGYRCSIDAARPITSNEAVNTVDYQNQNHGSLTIIYYDAVKLRKKSLDVAVSTFEFLLGHTHQRMSDSSCY